MSNGDEFERWLLDSAREDALPAGATERAWSSFAAATGAMGAAVSGEKNATRLEVSKATAAKWLVVGALGGGAVVALWLRGAPPQPAVTAPVVSVVASSPLPVQPSAAPAPVVELPPVPQPSEVTVRREAREAPAKMRSTLAAEVALLDGVRRSLASGLPGEALQSLARYERRFPAGLLASDAEVLTIEALRAKGDAEGARARATRFLAKHPRDPHTERVRALAAKP